MSKTKPNLVGGIRESDEKAGGPSGGGSPASYKGTEPKGIPVTSEIEAAVISPWNALAAIAESQIGVHEVGDTNTGSAVALYQSSTWKKGTGWPWCAAFVSWCILKLMETLGDKHPLSITLATRPQEPGVRGFLQWARARGQIVFELADKTYCPQRGDIVAFEFRTGMHIGIVTRPLANGLWGDGPWLHTVEGNTTDDPNYDEDGNVIDAEKERNGGEVCAKTRNLGSIAWFVRLRPSSEGVTA